MTTLFEPLQVGALSLSNRIVMAPLTRNRAPDAIPTPLMAEYYAQRASAGLLITEATAICHEGQGYADVPGLYGTEQLDGWKKVTAAVHQAGGRIVLQLWHVGRNSHVSLQPDGAAPVSSVDRRPINVNAYAWAMPGVPGNVETSQPRALRTDEIPAIIAEFVAAGQRAMHAGFDGVEVHGANGYLFEQFINGELNTRQDQYGGNIDNRLRLLLETIDALSKAIGAEHVGVRISPFGRLYDMHPYDDEKQTWFQ